MVGGQAKAFVSGVSRIARLNGIGAGLLAAAYTLSNMPSARVILRVGTFNDPRWYAALRIYLFMEQDAPALLSLVGVLVLVRATRLWRSLLKALLDAEPFAIETYDAAVPQLAKAQDNRWSLIALAAFYLWFLLSDWSSAIGFFWREPTDCLVALSSSFCLAACAGIGTTIISWRALTRRGLYLDSDSALFLHKNKDLEGVASIYADHAEARSASLGLVAGLLVAALMLHAQPEIFAGMYVAPWSLALSRTTAPLCLTAIAIPLALGTVFRHRRFAIEWCSAPASQIPMPVLASRIPSPYESIGALAVGATSLTLYQCLTRSVLPCPQAELVVVSVVITAASVARLVAHMATWLQLSQGGYLSILRYDRTPKEKAVDNLVVWEVTRLVLRMVLLCIGVLAVHAFFAASIFSEMI